MNIVDNIYYPDTPWSNPFNKNLEFDIILSSSGKYIKDITLCNSKIYIKYSTFNDIITFIEDVNTNKVKDIIKKKLVKIVFIGDDSYPIFESDFNYIEKNKWLFENKNIQFWQTNYLNKQTNIRQKLYMGVYIHYFLKNILKFDYNHLENNFTKHFLTLNNKEKPNRVELFKLYENLNEPDKEKIIASFNFKSKFLDKNLFENNKKNQDYELYYTLDILNFYKDVMFEIVCETGIINVTEKSYKPLILGVPFILYNMDSSNHLKYFENIGIDVNYFNIDYSDIKNVDKFILEILLDDISTIKEKWSDVFLKAKENRVKIYEYLNKIKQEIEKL